MTNAMLTDADPAMGVAFGSRFGLYELLAAGPVSACEVADWSGLSEIDVSRWLHAQSAAGYVVCDEAGRYRCWSPIKTT
jgi:hypothetical protein